MFLNRIDNLHNHDNSIIFIFIFLTRKDTIEKPGNVLITQFSDIIERIKSQPSAQRSTQNPNVGYIYFHSSNLNETDAITVNIYDNIQLHDICNLVQKLPYIYFGHIRLLLEDTRILNRAVKRSHPQISFPIVRLIC